MIPPLALIVSATFRFVAFMVPEFISPRTFSTRPVGMVKPPFAVIKPDILVAPATSRATVGDALPIPMRDLAPPTKYMLLLAFAWVPNWAIGAVVSVLATIILEFIVVRPCMLTSPTTSSLDFGAVLPIPIFPDGNIQKSTRLEVLLSILNMPLLLMRFQLL